MFQIYTKRNALQTEKFSRGFNRMAEPPDRSSGVKRMVFRNDVGFSYKEVSGNMDIRVSAATHHTYRLLFVSKKTAHIATAVMKPQGIRVIKLNKMRPAKDSYDHS